MPHTSYLDQMLQQHWLSGPAYTRPVTVYFALSSAQPQQAQGTGANPWNFVEPESLYGYARVAVDTNTTNFVPVADEPSNGYQLQNGILIPFPASTGPWLQNAILGYGGIWDAPNGGNLLSFGNLTPPVQVPGPAYSIQIQPGQYVDSVI